MKHQQIAVIQKSSTLILPSDVNLYVPSGVFPSDFPKNFRMHFTSLLMPHTQHHGSPHRSSTHNTMTHHTDPAYTTPWLTRHRSSTHNPLAHHTDPAHTGPWLTIHTQIQHTQHHGSPHRSSTHIMAHQT